MKNESDDQGIKPKRVFIISSLKEHFNKNPIIMAGIVIFLIYKIYSLYYESRHPSPSVELPHYQITKNFCKKPHKCVFEILLDDVISKKEIRQIANFLKQKTSGVKRVFIGYNLKCFSLAKGYSGFWAISNFEPELEISLLNHDYTNCADFKHVAKQWNDEVEEWNSK